MKKWWLDRSGATIIEFAIIAPIFFLMMMAIFEFGLITYSQVAVESAVAAVAREASLGKVGGAGNNRVSYIRQHLRTKLGGLINSQNIIISANTMDSGGVTTMPDICMTNPPSSPPTCNPPLIYENINGINGYQGASGLNMGDAGDLIEVRVYYPWEVQFPFMKQFFGQNGVIMITANSIVKNEPF